MKILFITDAPDRPETELLAKITEHADVTFMTKPTSRYFYLLKQTNAKFLDYNIQKRFDSKAIAQIKASIEEQNYDIIHAFNSRAITCALQAAKKSKTKILAYRGVSTNNSYLQLENWFSYLHPRLDGIFCVSEAIRQTFISLPFFQKNKARTIYKGHNPDWYNSTPISPAEFGVPENAVTLSCISRNSAKKGITTLLTAFESLPSELNAHLLLIGSIDKNQEVRNKIKQSKHPERIHFTGYRNDAIAIIAGSDLLVSASESGEGLPRVVLESMCVKTPVVATDAGGTRELVIDGETGLLVPMKKPQRLAQAIVAALENKDLSKQRADKAYARIVNSFNPELTLTNTLDWYKELLLKGNY